MSGGDTKAQDISIKFKLFPTTIYEAKQRVVNRDYKWLEGSHCGATLLDDIKSLDYIDKQYQQYLQVEKWLRDTYPQNEIV